MAGHLEGMNETFDSGREMRFLMHTVVCAGNTVKDAARAFEEKPGEGHRSGITEGDKRAHALMAEGLGAHFPNMMLLSEEGSSKERNTFDTKDPKGILEADSVIIFDPIDGTASFANDLGNWSTGGGLMRQGELVGSVIYAHDMNGGMLVTAEKGKGAFLLEKGSGEPKKIEPAPPHALKDCIVATGVDATLYKAFMDVVPGIAANVRAWHLANSGLLGLAQVATGRLQALIQTPQKPWDWAPAYRAVLETGRIFKFFRLVPDNETGDGTLVLVPVEHYDENAFSTDRDKRLGFVVGDPGVVNNIYDRLPKRGWKREYPSAE